MLLLLDGVMQIEKLGKIGIGVGIAVGALLIFMLILSLPNIINQYIPDYDAKQFEKPTKTQELNADVLMDIFSQTEDYAIFVQRNSDYEIGRASCRERV